MSESAVKYHPSKLPAIWVAAVIGTISVAYFFYVAGFQALARLYLWPSFVLTPFFAVCAVNRNVRWWHRMVWRSAQIWSGFWTILFVLSIVSGFGALLTLFFPLKWSMEMHVNPWVAVATHGLLFGCCTDALKEEKAPNA